MESYTTYHSGIHACAVVVQVFKGPERGLELSRNLYDLGQPDGECDAMFIARVLKEERLTCDVHLLQPDEVQQLIEDGLERRLLTIFRVKQLRGLAGDRWAVTQAEDRETVCYAVCVGPGERMPAGLHVKDFATGEAVQMRYQAWPPHNVVARIEVIDDEVARRYPDLIL